MSRQPDVYDIDIAPGRPAPPTVDWTEHDARHADHDVIEHGHWTELVETIVIVAGGLFAVAMIVATVMWFRRADK